jgi:four helix bundle protein
LGLVSQIRRAAISIPSNIAEGNARNHKKEFVQFLYVSLGSCAELETQMIISMNLGFVNKETLDELLEKIKAIRNLLIGLIK